MATSYQWESFTPQQKLTAATVDIMNHGEFVRMSGIVMMGNATITPQFPTAATNGRDAWYGEKFMALQNRRQTRWVILHENFHKALHHCTDYKDVVEKYPKLCNVAQDFCINAMIDELDPTQQFAERPAGVRALLDKKYYGWSSIEILRDLLKKCKNGGGGKGNNPGGPGSFPGNGTPGGVPGQPAPGDNTPITADELDVDSIKAFDEHIPSPLTEKEIEGIKQDIQDALEQGKIAVSRMAGDKAGNQVLSGLTKPRITDWRRHLREFVEQICEGYDYSRFSPPNKRFQPLDILMPSHFSETMGEIHVYCDTSGSMGGVYPIVFGEVVRIAQELKPKVLRLIWWDTEVAGEQVFKEGEYEGLASALKPAGGGGTSPQCVATYLAQKGYKPKAGIWLTDGYLDGSSTVLPWPVVWGVVGNESFVAPQGKKIIIDLGV